MFNGYVTDRHRWRDMSHQCVALYETDALDQVCSLVTETLDISTTAPRDSVEVEATSLQFGPCYYFRFTT